MRLKVALLATVLALGACSGDDDAPPSASPSEVSPTAEASASPAPEPECSLSSGDTDPAGARPAVAVKVENNPIAYPLAGLQDAEIVYEEIVEGGITRFLALYHCTDAKEVGPVRSARIIDPAIMSPYTRILAAAGGNDIVRKALKKSEIVLVDEKKARKAMVRIPRAGVAVEHTLFADTEKLRRLGARKFEEPPTLDIFTFGPLPDGGKKTKTITIQFSDQRTVVYEWGGGWKRFEGSTPFMTDDGNQLKVDNVLIEEHTVKNSKTLFDIAGNPSPEIVDETGTGRAVLFRDGQSFVGRWVRDSVSDPVSFETKSGDEMVLAEGSTWIELVPDKKGNVKGSFSFK